MSTLPYKKVIERYLANPSEENKTANGSLTVFGNTLYSYKTRIAWFSDVNGFCVNVSKYSSTTSKQQSYLKFMLAHIGREYTPIAL